MKYIGYGRQSIEERDIDAVVATLRGDYLTQGPAVAAFEEALARYVGARYAVVVANGTAALHAACLAAGMKSGDIGVTQAITFAASANCMAYCGARPDLVDIDPKTLNMLPDALRDYLRRVPQCKVVIPVAMGGLSNGLGKIREIAGERIIIEDACHALGGRSSEGSLVGSSQHADMTVFSFHPVKPITTGEGGAIVTNREDLYRRLLPLRSHGIVRAPEPLVDPLHAAEPWYYEQQMLGYNYRLCDIQAALGRSQLSRIDEFIARRREIALFYDREFCNLEGVSLVQADPDFRQRSGHHLYALRLNFDRLGLSRADAMEALRAQGIGTQVHYIPVHYHPYYRERFVDERHRLQAAEDYYRETLSLPCYPGLEDEDLKRIVASVREIVSGAITL